VRSFLVTAALIIALCTLVTLPGVAQAECPTSTAPATTAFDCDLAARITAADAYLANRPGSVGYVLRDRKTGAVYRNSHAADLVWTASTIKLAMVVDLLTRQRAGTVSLTDRDRSLIAAMLHSSDDNAADALWSRFGGTDHQAYNVDFPRYGMTDLRPQRGFTDIYPYWGFQKSTADDLDRLINYTLTTFDPTDRAGVVAALQHVASNQQWGVWGAGAPMAPGNKDGWSLEQGGWVVNSVGFAGLGQRYTLAVMNSLGNQGGYDDGVATTTELSRLLLAGRETA
jgi:beta-lactamase class A